MYHVDAQGVDELMINVHYYYYYYLALLWYELLLGPLERGSETSRVRVLFLFMSGCWLKSRTGLWHFFAWTLKSQNYRMLALPPGWSVLNAAIFGEAQHCQLHGTGLLGGSLVAEAPWQPGNQLTVLWGFYRQHLSGHHLTWSEIWNMQIKTNK